MGFVVVVLGFCSRHEKSFPLQEDVWGRPQPSARSGTGLTGPVLWSGAAQLSPAWISHPRSTRTPTNGRVRI